MYERVAQETEYKTVRKETEQAPGNRVDVLGGSRGGEEKKWLKVMSTRSHGWNQDGGEAA